MHVRLLISCNGRPDSTTQAVISLGTDPDRFPNSLQSPDRRLGVIAGIKEGSTIDHQIPGADDSLVPVNSTRVAGMIDFIVVKPGHSAMRYDKTAASQTINYLHHGRFQHWYNREKGTREFYSLFPLISPVQPVFCIPAEIPAMVTINAFSSRSSRQLRSRWRNSACR